MSHAAALHHYFNHPENHEAGAGVVNVLLMQIEAAGRKPRLTGDDFRRLAELFELLHVPGPLAQLDPPRHPRNDAPPVVQSVIDDIAARTRDKAANGPRNDKLDLPEASPPAFLARPR